MSGKALPVVTTGMWQRLNSGVVVKNAILTVFAICICFAASCSKGVEERSYSISVDSNPAAEAITLLQRYAGGAPVGSEITSFDQLLQKLKNDSASEYDAIASAFDAIKADPGKCQEIAKQTLEALN